jgi:glycosidase
MKKYTLFLLLTFALTANLPMFAQPSVRAGVIERIEPPNWWIGMKNPVPLQLLVYGNNIGSAEVRSLDAGVEILEVIRTENPNYLFIDLAIADDAKAGTYRLEFTINRRRTVHNYELLERRPGSALRRSFGPEDVVYLIMSDRFANGDPSNDSHPAMAEKADRSNPNGRHGGDIQGIINHLDYIKELGATVIWPTPLTVDNQPRFSYHGYACGDYYLIDPRYGTNELYRKMVAEAHARGMKVIKDIVPNHSGTAHWWFNDLPMKDWINQFPEFTRTSGQMAAQSDPHASQYDLNALIDGWFDRSMPDMNLRNPLVLTYLAQMAVWWVEFAGLDGIRVDTYPYSDKHGIAEWTRRIMVEYPNFNIAAEAWFGNAPMTAYWQANANNADGYNSFAPTVMDFPLLDNMVMATREQDATGWLTGMLRVYNSIAQDFVYKNPFMTMIFAENHDVHRLTWQLGGDIDKVKRVYTMLATMRGIPQIYQGTELLMQNTEHRGHGHERMGIPGGWPGDPVNAFTDAGRTPEQRDMFNFTKTIFNWRKTSSAVHNGRMMQFVPDRNVYVYFRYNDEECVMTIINNTSEDRKINANRFAEILNLYSSNGVNIINGENVNLDDYTIPARKSAIIVFRK